MRLLACAALLTALTAPAWGQGAPADPSPPGAAAPGVRPANMDLPTYIKQPEHQEAVVAAAKAQIKQVASACANATFKPTGQLMVLQPPAFSNGQPYAGAWSERVEARGCGPTRTLNVLTIIRQDGPAQVVGMMPGDTHTDPMMQKNALQYAQAIAVRGAPAGCRQMAFIDTKFDGYTGLPSPEVTDGRESRPWREIWTLSACGTLLDVELTFTPNARGTALAGANPVKHPG